MWHVHIHQRGIQKCHSSNATFFQHDFEVGGNIIGDGGGEGGGGAVKDLFYFIFGLNTPFFLETLILNESNY